MKFKSYGIRSFKDILRN